MSESDRSRWDRKYTAGEGPAHFEPKDILLSNQHLLRGGRALDVACGFGGNAMFLASIGYQVDAVDISGVALAQARTEATRRGLAINLLQADLEHWPVRPAHYDLIIVFFYLNRALMRPLGKGLRPGGILIQANRNIQFLIERPDFDPGYLLHPGELCQLANAAGLEILYHADGMPDRPGNSVMIAQRPS